MACCLPLARSTARYVTPNVPLRRLPGGALEVSSLSPNQRLHTYAGAEAGAWLGGSWAAAGRAQLCRFLLQVLALCGRCL